MRTVLMLLAPGLFRPFVASLDAEESAEDLHSAGPAPPPLARLRAEREHTSADYMELVESLERLRVGATLGGPQDKLEAWVASAELTEEACSTPERMLCPPTMRLNLAFYRVSLGNTRDPTCFNLAAGIAHLETATSELERPSILQAPSFQGIKVDEYPESYFRFSRERAEAFRLEAHVRLAHARIAWSRKLALKEVKRLRLLLESLEAADRQDPAGPRSATVQTYWNRTLAKLLAVAKKVGDGKLGKLETSKAGVNMEEHSRGSLELRKTLEELRPTGVMYI